MRRPKCEVIFGRALSSDAHRAEDVCRDLDKGYAIAIDAGFRKITSFRQRKSSILPIQPSTRLTNTILTRTLRNNDTFSDGKLAIPQLVDLYGARGFGAIAIVDHVSEESCLIGKVASSLGRVVTRATFPLYMEILKSERERSWEQYEMVLIAGFELSKNSVLNHRSAHILGIGISEYLSADGDASTLARSIHAQGGIAVAAHPVNTRKLEKQTYYLWDNRRELEREFDAWEVASGPFLFDEVKHSKLPKIASGDFHNYHQLCSWKTVLDCERSERSILNEIRKQRISFEFYGKRDSGLCGSVNH